MIKFQEYTILTTYGVKTVEGWVWNDLFGLKLDLQFDCWELDHIPSGFRLVRIVSPDAFKIGLLAMKQLAELPQIDSLEQSAESIRDCLNHLNSKLNCFSN